jgi:hypothetical protein
MSNVGLVVGGGLAAAALGKLSWDTVTNDSADPWQKSLGLFGVAALGAVGTGALMALSGASSAGASGFLVDASGGAFAVAMTAMVPLVAGSLGYAVVGSFTDAR